MSVQEERTATSRALTWFGRNVDGAIAVVVSLVIAVLGTFHNDTERTLNGILLVLGVLALAMLRDRARTETETAALREQLRQLQRLGPAVEAVQPALEAMSGDVARILRDASMVRTLTWSEVRATLADARRVSEVWVFRGGTGTYIRAVTLRECVANARRERRGLRVRLEIIDPTNDEVCAEYARFRRSLPGLDDEWSPARTRNEAYATIVAAAWHKQRYDPLDIQVGLSQVMPTLRWDLSSIGVVITQEDPRGSALLAESGKLLYEYLNTELRKSLEQARRVPLEQAKSVHLSDEPTVEEVVRLFAALNMSLPGQYRENDVADIIRRAIHAENWYDR